MELSQPDINEKISTVNGWPYKVCFYGANIINLFLIYLSFSVGWKSGAVMLVAAAIFIVVSPFAWGIGNWVRKFIKPDVYFTHGNKDAFKKKIFWLVGPQWSGFSGAYMVVVALPLLLITNTEEKGNKVPAPVVMEQVKISADAVPLPAAATEAATSAEPPPLATEKPAAQIASTAVPESPTAAASNLQSAVPSDFVVVAPEESKQMLTAMLQQPTSAFKISEIKGKIEALSKLPSGDRKAARKLNDQGLAALKADDSTQALTLLKSAVTADPADIEVLNNYVYALIKAKRLQDAESEAGRLLTMSPGRSSAWANIAEVYALQNNNQAAVAALILAFQFSSNKDRTVTFLKERATDTGSPLQTASKIALENIQKM